MSQFWFEMVVIISMAAIGISVLWVATGHGALPWPWGNLVVVGALAIAALMMCIMRRHDPED